MMYESIVVTYAVGIVLLIAAMFGLLFGSAGPAMVACYVGAGFLVVTLILLVVDIVRMACQD